jgi:hypothetical protein
MSLQRRLYALASAVAYPASSRATRPGVSTPGVCFTVLAVPLSEFRNRTLMNASSSKPGPGATKARLLCQYFDNQLSSKSLWTPSSRSATRVQVAKTSQSLEPSTSAQ